MRLVPKLNNCVYFGLFYLKFASCFRLNKPNIFEESQEGFCHDLFVDSYSLPNKDSLKDFKSISPYVELIKTNKALDETKAVRDFPCIFKMYTSIPFEIPLVQHLKLECSPHFD